jgi:hypothetical protein
MVVLVAEVVELAIPLLQEDLEHQDKEMTEVVAVLFLQLDNLLVEVAAKALLEKIPLALEVVKVV